MPTVEQPTSWKEVSGQSSLMDVKLFNIFFIIIIIFFFFF